jgi:hypothetical protein
MGLSVNQKGVIGLVKVTADLVSKQYEVFTPTSDSSPVDLIAADDGMNLKLVQVKYREPERRKGRGAQVLVVSLDSVVNGRRVPVDVSRIDVWAIYCPQTERVYYVKRSEVVGRSIRICLDNFKGRRNRLAQEFVDPARLWSGS